MKNYMFLVISQLQDAGIIYTCNGGVMIRTKKSTATSETMDELHEDGIETSAAMTEKLGDCSFGKTTLDNTLCVFTTQLPSSMKGGIGKVAYVVTEGTFRPDHIVSLAEKFGRDDAAAVLDNHNQLLLGSTAKTAEEPVRVLDDDSIIAGRGWIRELAGSKKTSVLARISTGSNAWDELLRGRTYYAIPRSQVNIRFGNEGDRRQQADTSEGISNAGGQPRWTDLRGLAQVLEDDDDEEYVSRVGRIIPILEFQNADWEITCEVEHDLGDRRGEVDLDTCFNWTDLTEKVHLVYVQQTGNQRVDLVNSTNCWPGKLTQFCVASGYPGLSELDGFNEVKVQLDSIKIRPHAN